MSSTPKRFTRYDAEHHDPATEYVLASEYDARLRELRNERNDLARLRDSLLATLEQTQAQLAALSCPVVNAANPLLTVESGGIRYVLEVISDEGGDWFEVKSATPTESLSITDFGIAADGQSSGTLVRARAALAQYRAARREDDEAGAAE